MRTLLRSLPLLVLLTAACSAPRELLDERSAEPYASWSRLRGLGARRTVETVEAQAPGEPVLRMRLVHLASASPADDRPLVLQPGVLADHRTWRFLAPMLAERGDVLLVDPPGTGGSDKPDPAQQPQPAYTPEWIGQHTLRAVDRWQRRRGDARRLVLVGHSLGSAAYVRALTDPSRPPELAEIVARIDGLVLIVMPDVLMEGEPEALRTVAELTDLEARAGSALGILDREMAETVYGGVANPVCRGLKQEAERLGSMIRDDRTRHAAQAMLKRFVALGDDGRPVPSVAQAIAARERTLELPVLLIWGVQDDTLPHTSAAQVAARLPRVERLDVPDARHSPHQERADLVAWAIARFLSAHPPRGR